MAIHEYIGEGWQGILQHNHADGFEQLWALDADHWFEPPNQRRGGWSGVVRTKLALPEGGEVGIFIKRQENHFYRAIATFFFPRATFAREYDNLLQFVNLGIPTLDVVYFGQRKLKGKVQAILITRELEGYQSLEDPTFRSRLREEPCLRKILISKLAHVIQTMHSRHMQHNCLYPKHIFVKSAGAWIDIRIIDLEKAKWRLFTRHAMLRDLGTLHRHTTEWSKTDRLRFFLACIDQKHLDKQSKALLRAILNHKKRVMTRTEG